MKEHFSPKKKLLTIAQLVIALAYRFKIQEQIFMVAESLIEQDLLSVETLHRMDLFR